ncbi:MAG: hypothetical protein FWB86_06405 [Treponema sp.]|nr:hypothetical protein [Treponema sp.]MCL2251878.1 hypothetical protein [Treponema sp.]
MDEKDKTQVLTDSYAKLNNEGREKLDLFVQSLEKENDEADINQQKKFSDNSEGNKTF